LALARGRTTHLSLPRLAAASCVCAVAAAGVHAGTFAHQFILADNRHYTFYLWQRVLGPLGRLRVALAPVYVTAGAGILTRIAWSAADRRQGAAFAALWLAASGAVLVPAPLLEPRYFTVPLLLALAHVRHDRPLVPGLLLAAHCVVNAATLYMFIARPFVRPDGVGRFMW
jgi:alpha-1,2-glucosyltransferase